MDRYALTRHSKSETENQRMRAYTVVPINGVLVADTLEEMKRRNVVLLCIPTGSIETANVALSAHRLKTLKAQSLFFDMSQKFFISIIIFGIVIDRIGE